MNSNNSLVINNDLSMLKYTKNFYNIELHFSEIARIVFYLPPSAYRGSTQRKLQFLPIEPYGYAVIHSNEGDQIAITSLMVPDVYNELKRKEGPLFEKKKRLFASPTFEKIMQWFRKEGI